MNCGERYEFKVDHRSYTHNLSSCEIKTERNSGLNGIPTHDLCDTSAGLLNMYNNFFLAPYMVTVVWENPLEIPKMTSLSYTKAWPPKPLVSVSFEGDQSELGIKVKNSPPPFIVTRKFLFFNCAYLHPGE